MKPFTSSEFTQRIKNQLGYSDDVERHGEAESYSDWIRNRDRIQNERDAEEHKWNQYENREN